MPFCSFTRKLLVAVVDKWNSHVLVIDKVAPPNWKVCFPVFYCMTCWGCTILAWFFMFKNCYNFWVTTLIIEDLPIKKKKKNFNNRGFIFQVLCFSSFLKCRHPFLSSLPCKCMAYKGKKEVNLYAEPVLSSLFNCLVY